MDLWKISFDPDRKGVVPANAKWRPSQFCSYLASCRAHSVHSESGRRSVITTYSRQWRHPQRYRHHGWVREASGWDFEALWPVCLQVDQGLWTGGNNWSSSHRICPRPRHQAEASQQAGLLPGIGGKYSFVSISFTFTAFHPIILWSCVDDWIGLMIGIYFDLSMCTNLLLYMNNLYISLLFS